MPRLMFIRGSQPLPNARIRVDGASGIYQTDEEGRVEIPVERDKFTVDIETDDGEIRKTVEAVGRDSLTVVNLTEGPTTGDEELRRTDGLGTAIRRQFGERYRYDKILGQGGMGIVVRATDELLERPVAVKVLSGELADYEEAREIFLTEARSLATLSHPNLVAVYDIDDSGRRPMMVSEFVDGKTLEQIVGLKGGLGQETVLRMGVQLTRALEYLHGEGVIHRDLKPSNVMLQDDGSLKLIDFGLARSLKKLAEKGTRVRGTPAYMAPEQLTGDRLDERVDTYQVGVTLYEAASGQLPFPDGDIAYKHVHEPAPRLDDHVPNVLPGLADVIESCMAKDPDDRPASMTVLREELERLYGILTSSRVDRDTLTNPDRSRRRSTGGLEAEERSEEAAVEPRESVETEDEESANGIWIGGGVALLLLAGTLLLLGVGGGGSVDEETGSEGVAVSASEEAGDTAPVRMARADSGGEDDEDKSKAAEALSRSRHVVAVAVSAATSATGAIGQSPESERGGVPSASASAGTGGGEPSAGGSPPSGDSEEAAAVGAAANRRAGGSGAPEAPSDPTTAGEGEAPTAPTPATDEKAEPEEDGEPVEQAESEPASGEEEVVGEAVAAETADAGLEAETSTESAPPSTSEETGDAGAPNREESAQVQADEESIPTNDEQEGSDEPSVPGVGGREEPSTPTKSGESSGETESSGGEREENEVPVSF